MPPPPQKKEQNPNKETSLLARDHVNLHNQVPSEDSELWKH